MRIVIDPAFVVGEVDERLFGSFVEHMGRAVYGGIYEPGHETADADGFRGDVLELVREMGVSLVRYPGGNFVSAYDWEDGVGPERPQRLDIAWHSIEPNTFGTDEFMRWADRAGVQPLLAVNLGTRGIDAARALLEYVNGTRGTKWADLRPRDEPYGVKLWCLGNEMDGPWQVGQKTAVEYGRLAAETGKAMRWVDPSIELCVAGSSNSSMPTFGHWEDTVLDLAWDVADYVSLHTYYDPLKYETVDEYLRCSQDLDRMIDTVVATADAVAGRKRSRQADEDQRRRVERVASDGQPAPRRPRRAVQARARAGRGRAHRRRRARRRLPADHAAAPRRPGQDRLPRAARQRDPADPHPRRRSRLAPDHVSPVRARVALRARDGAAGGAGRRLAGGDGGARRRRPDGVRGQPGRARDGDRPRRARPRPRADRAPRARRRARRSPTRRAPSGWRRAGSRARPCPRDHGTCCA